MAFSQIASGLLCQKCHQSPWLSFWKNPLWGQITRRKHLFAVSLYWEEPLGAVAHASPALRAARGTEKARDLSKFTQLVFVCVCVRAHICVAKTSRVPSLLHLSVLTFEA